MIKVAHTRKLQINFKLQTNDKNNTIKIFYIQVHILNIPVLQAGAI